jgi:hypothetical protein
MGDGSRRLAVVFASLFLVAQLLVRLANQALDECVVMVRL